MRREGGGEPGGRTRKKFGSAPAKWSWIVREIFVLLESGGKIHAFVEDRDDADHAAGEFAEEDEMMLVPDEPNAVQCRGSERFPTVAPGMKRVNALDEACHIRVGLLLTPFSRVEFQISINLASAGPKILADMGLPEGFGFPKHRVRIQRKKPGFVRLSAWCQFIAQPFPFPLLLPLVVAAHQIANILVRRHVKTGAAHPALDELMQRVCKSDVDSFGHDSGSFYRQQASPPDGNCPILRAGVCAVAVGGWGKGGRQDGKKVWQRSGG